ncbi:GNAT family N-acetyltransferase [Oceanidesulfovibrio marinus]|uniref:GNAT family N-acetyltransferase n=1 Tax=Oceanidesulfovibrio marinus TaxID=370038 RepID=UPI001C0F18FC|nr:N-acetyltransferase [Oceanidesulfovibrio marinus]
MIIRNEELRDIEAIRTVHVEAFASHPYSRQTEHLIVDGLREAGALSVSLVADMEGQVVGHIAFSPALVGGAECGLYILGPVGVLPPFQRRGVGSRLVRDGLEAIRAMGATGCVLVGDPAFYRHFGFVQAAPLTMEGVPPEVVLYLPMADTMPRGAVTHHSAFHVEP